MRRNYLALFSIVVVLLILTGCATMADARAAKGSGLSRIFAAPQERVWQAMPSVLTELGLSLAGDNRQEGYILAQRGVTTFSYGENVAIFIEPEAGTAKTRVEVVSKKAVKTQIFAPDWAKDILDKLDQRLAHEG